MAADFHDHPRKRVIRENWNTPLLELLHERLGEKLVYLGLPGSKALDVKHWRNLLQHVTAFELETDNPSNRRQQIVELNRELGLLKASSGISYQVFSGPMEEAILRRKDHDGNAFCLDRFVTLFNFDFCDAITGEISVPQGRRRWRFSAIKDVLDFLTPLYDANTRREFIFLLTARDSMHARTAVPYLQHPELPEATRQIIEQLSPACGLPTKGRIEKCPGLLHTELLRVLTYSFLREQFLARNIVPVFLPPVAYLGGRGGRSPMFHMAVVCRTANPEEPRPEELQTAQDFFSFRMLCADDNSIGPYDGGLDLPKCETDPVTFLRASGFLS